MSLKPISEYILEFFLQWQKVVPLLLSMWNYFIESTLLEATMTLNAQVFEITPSHRFCNLWALPCCRSARKKRWSSLFALWDREGVSISTNLSLRKRETGSAQDFKQPEATWASLTQPPHLPKKLLPITLKRNICHFRGLHPMSH